MLLGLYMSAAGLQAQDYRASVTANNLANAETTGFKRDLALIQSRRNAFQEDPALAAYSPPQPSPLNEQGGGVSVLPSVIDLAQGTFRTTGNQTDLALNGQGFFSIAGPDGKPALTRDGSFLIKSDGTLVTASGGYSVLDADGQPVKLNPQLPVLVNSHGQLTQGTDTGTGIQLGIKDVTNPQALQKLGENLLTAPDAALRPASDATMVRQGTLENSTVDPATELVNMLEGQRAFDANAKMIRMQDQTLSQLNTIGRVA